MKSDGLLVLTACLMIAAACAPPPSFDTAHREALRDSVAVFLDAFEAASGGGDPDVRLAMYEDGSTFRWVEDGAVRYRSVADIRAALAALPAGLRIDTEYREVEIHALAPGLAWVLTDFSSTFYDGETPSFSFGGAITMIVRHHGAGWRIAGGHVSSPRPRGGSGDGS